MAYTISIDPDKRVIRVDFRGDVTFSLVKEAAREVWQKRFKGGPYRYLSILLDAQLRFKTTELLALQEFYESIGISKEMRNAIVIPQNDKIIEDATIHEIAASLENWHIKIFMDIQQAETWLMQCNEDFEAMSI